MFSLKARLLKPWWHIPPTPRDLEGVYGRNKESLEFLEFPKSLDGLGLIQWKDYLRNSQEHLLIPPKATLTLTS
jgi:hypothetical protein